MKFCYYIVQGQVDSKGSHIPSVVFENKSGHYPAIGKGKKCSPWTWGTFKQAQKIATVKNRRLGLNEKEVQEIIDSSMLASIKERYKK